MSFDFATRKDLIDFKDEIMSAITKPSQSKEDRLMDTKMICEYLNIEPSTFYKYRNRLPVYKVCGKLQAWKSDIDKYISKNKIV